MNFQDLSLIQPILGALQTAGYTTPTPIQAQSIPVLLAGQDLCGTAQTGTGKTAAFALPILQRLTVNRGSGGIRALILAPTRELAAQIGEAFETYGRHLSIRCAVVLGGMGMRQQQRMIRMGPEVVVATPGRLLDLCERGVVRLDKVECFVLDEADRMLDMGFINDVRLLVKKLPSRRQTVMFSATLPKDIEKLAGQILRNPVRVSVAPPSAVADRIEQQVIFVEKVVKRLKLLEILSDPSVTSAIVFVRTKQAADRVTIGLVNAKIRAGAIHGDKIQAERIRVLNNFTNGVFRVLVATDVAARGIDIEGISHVINYDIPNVSESYVHRIGRTARAGAAGVAISLCSTEELKYLKDIEKLIGKKLTPRA